MAMSQEKTIEILGLHSSGKATLMGNLLFKCGGIDMLTMESLQRAGVVSNDQVMGHLQRNNITTSFQTRRYTMNFTTLTNADYTFYLVVAKDSSESIPAHILESLRGAKHLVVLVNKMDVVEWSKESYLNTARKVLSALEVGGIDTKSVQVIPISALYGDNLVELSTNSSWNDESLCSEVGLGLGQTLIDLIDEV